MVTGVASLLPPPSPPPGSCLQLCRAIIGFSNPSHCCSSIFHLVLLSHAPALSAKSFFRLRKQKMELLKGFTSLGKTKTCAPLLHVFAEPRNTARYRVMTDSTLASAGPPARPQNQRYFFNERFTAARHEEGCNGNKKCVYSIHVFSLFAKGHQGGKGHRNSERWFQNRRFRCRKAAGGGGVLSCRTTLICTTRSWQAILSHTKLAPRAKQRALICTTRS